MSLNMAVVLCFSLFAMVAVAEDPYRFFNWNVTYGDIYPLGVRQQVLFSSYVSYICVVLEDLIRMYHAYTYREYLSTVNSQVQTFILLPTTTSSSMSSTAWTNPFSYPGNNRYFLCFLSIRFQLQIFYLRECLNRSHLYL